MTSDARRDFEAQTNVSRETMARLEIYADLVEKWNPKINLIAKSTVETLWSRHFLDSAQLFDISTKQASWADLGSGGGFPGAVIAILAQDAQPDLNVTLVESDQRKSAFLRTVFRETGVKATVSADRIEELPKLGADTLSARALAPLKTLLSYADQHLDPKGQAIFPKGAKADEEIKEALEHWRFDCEIYLSKTDEDAVILKVGEIERV